MIEYDLLKILSDYMRSFRDIRIPVLILDTGFGVLWRNASAQKLSSVLASAESLGSILAEFDPGTLLAVLRNEGSATLADPVSFADTRLSLTPVIRDGAVAAVILIPEPLGDSLGDFLISRRSKTADTLGSGIRSAMDGVFKALDALEMKSGILDVNWLAPHLGEIASQAYQALRIAVNVTEYARLQNGEASISPAICNLTAWLEEITEALHGLAEKAGIPLHIMIPHEDCLVRLDLPRFETAFFNILHNALYYTKPGNEVFIAVQCRPSGAELVIQDRGLGIPRDILFQLFTPYFSYTHGLPIGGAGLGLTLARRIVLAHGGDLEISSESGEGTRIAVKLKANSFTDALSLNQPDPDYSAPGDRFSSLYVGLAGVSESPFARQ